MTVARFSGWAAAVTMALGMAVPVSAGGIAHTTPPGWTQDGQPVDMSATLATGANSLVAVVHNLQTSPDGVVPDLSHIDVVASAGQTGVGWGGRLASTSRTARTVGKASRTGTRFALCVICPSGGAEISWPRVNPVHTIMGDVASSSGFYTDASGSIVGNVSRNPFLFAPVTFDLHIGSLSETAAITGVESSFRASPTTTAEGCVVCTSVPSPVLLVALLIFVAAGLVVGSRWARRNAPPAQERRWTAWRSKR